MRTYFHKKVWIGFLIAISIIAWLGITSLINNKKFEHTTNLVTHTNRVLFHTEQLLSLTVDLESGQRGYSLTGREEFLEPTHHAFDAIGGHFDKLRNLTSDNPSQQTRIDILDSLVNRKLAFTSTAVRARQSALQDAIEVNSTMEGKVLTDHIRSIITDIQQEEEELLSSRTRSTEKKMRNFQETFLALILATLVILILVFYWIYVSLKARSVAEANLIAVSAQIKDMYNNAPCGYHSLDPDGLFIEINNTWLYWLKYNREEIVNKVKFVDLVVEEHKEIFNESFRQFKKEGHIKDFDFDVMRKDGTVFSVLLNASAVYGDDGKFIKSRSTVIDYTEQKLAHQKIEQLNKELESFSYSVSHDLRAPLRSIDGYTQILLEDYQQNFDTEGKRVLNVIINNARKMARLIDDLLDFSRVGRKEISKTTIQMEMMVHSVFSEVKAPENGRQIELHVQPLHVGVGDPNLIRQVWHNLISNAVKYTRKKDKAIITISSRSGTESIIYKIVDNGTGFDMNYSHKLFGVFQRLHRHQDFEGTGVGLAIVHRIIDRHGGKVWAESTIGEGATFYFSLPSN